ncbi:hypothetical protein [Phenylobacterium sp.]|uniref:hypothetical protein n=1 Tax=Phenylobacterium sp. TaxID=1871053 RepID=UPI003D2AC66C
MTIKAAAGDRAQSGPLALEEATMPLHPSGDRRRPLRLAKVTWDRHDLTARQRLAREAAILGYRLVIVSQDGVEHETSDNFEAS